VFRSLAFMTAAAVMTSCMVDPGAPVGAVTEPIVDGVVERAHPEVVFLYNLGGSACTASLIAPRVVLTAKHCVQGRGAFAADPSSFRVYVGSSTRSFTAEYLVDEIRPAPGCWDLCGDASDVAVMILSAPAAEAPLLGQIPVDPELAELCDSGDLERYTSEPFDKLAKAFSKALKAASVPRRRME